MRQSLLAAAFLLVSTAVVSADSGNIRGLPFTRVYSHEDIGYVPRSARLNFDSFGRLAVIHEGVYTVLNDNVWINVAEAIDGAGIPMGNVVAAPDGRAYYGGRGSWGRASIAADGRLRAIPEVPANSPSWTSTAVFGDVVPTSDGIFFGSWNGVVYLDYETQRSQLFESSNVTKIFSLGNSVYVSGAERPLQKIDVRQGRMEAVRGTELDNSAVELAAPLDDGKVLVFLQDGRLVVFDGQQTSPWPPQARYGLTGRVAVLQHLVDGRMAVAITGRGLFLISATGEMLMALTAPEYHRITALANRETGVLWAATEEAIQKILYGSSFTTFGQRLGLTLGWPVVARCNDHTFVASEGSLYEAVAGPPGAASRFELQPNQPPGGAWALAAWGSRMLVGSGRGIFSVGADGQYQNVGVVAELAHLVMSDADHFYAIGRREMAYFEWRAGNWVEAAPRIPGVPYPSVVRGVGRSVWIEMGGDGVARVTPGEGRLQISILKNSEWTTGLWVNVGSVGDTVVLSGAQGERRFFDEKTGQWCEAPNLQRLLARAPVWIARMQNDADGNIWATHNDGLVRFSPNGAGYEMDTTSFDVINDRYPVVRVLDGHDVWISAAQSLSHVEQGWVSAPIRPAVPKLVSLVDTRDGRELLNRTSSLQAPLRLPFSKNSVTLSFFSGSDGWRRTPSYEYRLDEEEPWTPLVGSQLALRGLHEGPYRLQLRIAGRTELAKLVAVFPFEVLPPWYRTAPAYALFALGAVLVLVGVFRWSAYVASRRNRILEEVVKKRTAELRVAMEKLNEETRNAATQEERDRLASEIHDSLQQGLTGAILQLDTTMRLPSVAGEVRSRLTVARNMVSYARQEVQHTVWDMESPLLKGTELAEALQNLTAFFDSNAAVVDVVVTGEALPLTRAASHNLLRIAQEATTNALRHANAGRIAIRLDYGAAAVSLEIADDGIGFSPDEVLEKMTGHFGLRGIRARAKKLHGNLTIRSSPNQGATVRIEIPIQANTSRSETAPNDELDPNKEDQDFARR